MKKLLTLLAVILLSLNANADQLRYVSENQAKRAILYFKRFDIKQVVLWCSCCTTATDKKLVDVENINYREVLNAGRSYPEKTYEVVIKGKTREGKGVDEGVDLAYVWVPFGELAHTLAYELEIPSDTCGSGFTFPRWEVPGTTAVVPPIIYTYVEQMPEPAVNIPRFLAEHLEYPAKATRLNVEGKVIVRFVVDEGGNVISVEALTNHGAGLEQEAIRVVSLLPKWKPGIQDGKPVKVYYTLPISFHLRN